MLTTITEMKNSKDDNSRSKLALIALSDLDSVKTETKKEWETFPRPAVYFQKDFAQQLSSVDDYLYKLDAHSAVKNASAYGLNSTAPEEKTQAALRANALHALDRLTEFTTVANMLGFY